MLKIYRLQVKGCEAKGGRNCDGGGSRLCDGFVRQNSTFLGGLFTRFYDCVRVYFTITTKPLRFRQRHDFRLFFYCAYTQKRGCALSVQNFHDSLHSTHNYVCGTIRLDFLRLSNDCVTEYKRLYEPKDTNTKGKELLVFIRLGYGTCCYTLCILVDT